ncbi:MAG: hypothetical protein GF330_05045 [Candidatus Eisenbacteria bacterium]|nr:hypothetical protein [Candidatus Eisenbacteria bacterium]
MLRILVIIGCVLWIAPTAPRGATLLCGPGWTYPTIRSALETAQPGDTVRVFGSGPYQLDDYDFPNGVCLFHAGGASCLIQAGETRHLRLRNCSDPRTIIRGFAFADGHAPGEQGCGGSILIEGAFGGLLRDCSFVACCAGAHGGAVAIQGGGGAWSGEIVGCRFVDCRAGLAAGAGNGGALYVQLSDADDPFLLRDCTFSGNRAGVAGGRGGALCSVGALSGMIDGCLFEGNCAYATPEMQCHGGAAALVAKDLSIARCRFERNRIEQLSPLGICYGGGLYVAGLEGGDPMVTHCRFEENQITPLKRPDWQNGGGLFLRDFRGYVEYDTLIANRAGRGGGIYQWSPSAGAVPLRFRFNRFLHNRATTDTSYGGHGGGLVTDHQTFTIEQCIFEADSADGYGGGFYGFCPGAQSILDCDFRDCRAGYAGGAIASALLFRRIAGCTIEDCHADSIGGAIAICNQAVTDAALTIEQTRIRGCTAGDVAAEQGSGGGIYFRLANAADSLRFLTLSDCRAYRGGALDIEGGLSTLHNCTIAGNQAVHGAGIRIADACELRGQDAPAPPEEPGADQDPSAAGSIEQTIIAFNLGGEGLRCRIDEPRIACTDIFGNQGGDWTGELAALLGIEGNICADPLFCPAEAGAFPIASSSPCAPFAPPNAACDLIGAWSVGCDPARAIEAHRGAPRLRIVGLGPTPFLQSTGIRFRLPHPSAATRTTLAVHDLRGRRIRRISLAGLPAGWHTALWDGRDGLGRRVPSGAYFWQLRQGERRVALRTLLIH